MAGSFAQLLADYKESGIRVEGTASTVTAAAVHVFGRLLRAEEIVGMLGVDKAKEPLDGTHSRVTLSSREDRVFMVFGEVMRDEEQLFYASRTFSLHEGNIMARHGDYGIQDRNMQCKGISGPVIQSQIRTYNDLGVHRIDLDANKVGRYYWPKLGFELAEGHDIDPYLTEFHKFLSQNAGLERSAIKMLFKEQKVNSLHGIAAATVDDHKVGKEFLTQSPINGLLARKIPMKLQLRPSHGKTILLNELGICETS